MNHRRSASPIKSFFDTIDHKVLAQLMSRHFREKRLFNLYWKLVRAGYIEFNSKRRVFVASDVGVPQGGIVSPLLSNLMLHELDIYMEKLKLLREAASLGHKPTTRNPLYSSASNTIRKCVKLRARTDLSKDSRKQIHSLLYAALRLRKRTRSELRNPGHSKIDYVRYADD